MSARRTGTRASVPLQGRAARASSRDVKKVQSVGLPASKRHQEAVVLVRKVRTDTSKAKRKRGDSDGSVDNVEEEEEEEEGAAAAEEEAERMKGKSAREGSSGGSKKLSAIDPKADELLMRAVVAQENKLTDAKTKKMPVWDAIAKACGSRFKTGHTAFGKVKWLQRVARDRHHAQHQHLPPMLLKLLKQYIHFMEAPQKDERAEDEHVTLKEVVDDEDSDDSSESLAASRKGTKLRRVTDANVAEEEELMAIVLKHASRFATTNDRSAVWDSIARESRGRFESGSDARRHYELLVQWLEPTHAKHSMLTPILRVQLQELQDSGYDRPLQEGDELPSEPATTARVPPTRLPTAQEDDCLLYEILRVRPFDHKGESNPYWEKILAALHQRPGSTDVFPDRTACQKRMSRLLNAVRRPDLPSTPRVTPLQLEVLKVLHSILELKYQWSAMVKENTPFYRSVAEQINTLREKIKPKAGGGTRAKPTLLLPASRPALGELPELPAEPETLAVSMTEDEEMQAATESTAAHELHAAKQILASASVRALSMQANELEREQRDDAKAFEALVQVLQDEREQLQRESERVLRKVERQRADRKEEFKTMINLVAHAAAQYRA